MAAVETIPSYESVTFRTHEALPRASISSTVEYIEPSGRTSSASFRGAPPPAFSAFGRPTVLHSYSMRALRLEFRSFAPKPESLPIFFTNSVVSGTMTWTPKSSEIPRSISVTIEGTLERTSIAHASMHNSEGDARNRKAFWSKTITFYPTLNMSKRAMFRAGSHVFPFEFSIPAFYKPLPSKTFGLDYLQPGSSQKLFHLPPTFVERGFPYTLQFAIVADVKRGALKLDHQIRALFRHVPVTLPSRAASPLRLDAYRHNLVLPPPEFDLDGYSSTSATIKGQLDSTSSITGRSRSFDVNIEAFLPLPREYPSGSPIHFFLKLSSSSDRPSLAHSRTASSAVTDPSSRSSTTTNAPQDVERTALSVLSNPDSIEVSLERVFHVDRSPVPGAIDTVSVAHLWRVYDEQAEAEAAMVTSGRQEVLLQGEIVVRGPTMPDFTFPCLDLSYQIDVKLSSRMLNRLKDINIDPPPGTLSPIAPYSDHPLITPPIGQHHPPSYKNNSGYGAILSVPVRLTNASRLGEPKPRSYAPAPSYD